MQTTTSRLFLAITMSVTVVTGTALAGSLLRHNVLASPTAQLPPLGYAVLNNTEWISETVDTEGDVGQNPSLVIDKLGLPHIAYHDVTRDALKYAAVSNTTWVSETIEVSALDPSLALDSSGKPLIAYTHRGPEIRYAVLSGTTWITETVDSQMVAGPSLALDSLGNPHIAYCDVRPTPPSGPGLGLKYAYWTPSGWVRQAVDAVTCDSTSLALDSLDVPHIAYHNTASDAVKYAVLSDTTWISQTVDVSALGPSLALDNLGSPRIAYTQRGPTIKYAVLSGTTWISETVDSQMVAGPSLALDSLGNPHVAYCDVRPTPPSGPGLGLKYAYWTPSKWVIESIDGVVCDATSMVLDRSNNPHITYHANDDLKYAHLKHKIYLPLIIR